MKRILSAVLAAALLVVWLPTAEPGVATFESTGTVSVWVK